MPYLLQKGSVRGTLHTKQDTNNQDACMVMEFDTEPSGTHYRVGLVSDGCSGLPAFSHTEVGSQLLMPFAMGVIQELIAAGSPLALLPTLLLPHVAGFFTSLARLATIPGMHWPYPAGLREREAFRYQLKPHQRLMVDYLAATLLGVIDDGERLVVFRVGDGVTVINDTAQVHNQHNTPDYPVFGWHGLSVQTFKSAEVYRVAIATDGLAALWTIPGVAPLDRLFSNSPYGVQGVLRVLRDEYPEKFTDDCTAVVLKRQPDKEVTDDQGTS